MPIDGGLTGLTCSGLPEGATCTFNPSTVTPGWCVIPAGLVACFFLKNEYFACG